MDVDWKSLGINAAEHRDLIGELALHNQSILSKLESFLEIIRTSRLAKKDYYQAVLDEHRELLCTITLYHDIGKVRDHFNHGEHSYDILEETQWLQQLQLPDTDRDLTLQVIRHHLLIGTLFIGELSIKMLNRLDRQLDTAVDKPLFYTLLVIFSVLDTWAYTDDPAYAARLLYNYDRMVQHFQQRGANGLIRDHLAWRFCCFMGAWRGLDYLDYQAMSPFETQLASAMSRYYGETIVDVRTWIASHYQRLNDLNLHYAIWLLGNCCYQTTDHYYRHRSTEVCIHDGFFALLEDMVSIPMNASDDGLWQIQLSGYRKPRERAYQVFERIRSPEKMQKVLNNKQVNIPQRQVFYDFSLI